MLRIQNINFAKLIIRRTLSSTAQSNPIIVNTQESKIQQSINGDVKDGNPVPVFKKAILNNSKIAVKDLNGEKSYSDLVTGSFKLSKQISDVCGKEETVLFIKSSIVIIFIFFTAKQSLSRVAFLCQNDVSYIISQWATWMSGQVGELKINWMLLFITKYFIYSCAIEYKSSTRTS